MFFFYVFWVEWVGLGDHIPISMSGNAFDMTIGQQVFQENWRVKATW